MPLTFVEIYRVVRLIPRGRVMSYSAVARQCGYPRAARQVGYALAGLPPKLHESVPWWRVINAAGRISNAYHPEQQAKRLRAEGVAVDDGLRVALRLHDGETQVYAKLSRAAARQSAARQSVARQASPR
jgi:methylated-DNA-protein-cysteine methyltransferase related protein